MTTPVETPAPPKKRISGAWYALVALPWIIAIATWYVHLPRVIAGFADLRSKTYVTQMAPFGEVTIASKSDMQSVSLHAGENTIYVEGVDVLGHTEAKSELTCVLADDGHVVTLARDTSTTMTIGASTFVSQYTAQIEHDGQYLAGCSSTSEARYSIGRSFPFVSIVLLVLAMILALPVTGVIGYLVHRVRNGKRNTTRVT
jgi:hypothetical protein